MEITVTQSGLYLEQMYTGCLAEAAYYIESQGEVAIIDPMRETEPYISKAQARGAQIKYVFETHFHADFVSGHVDLANKTAARIIYGPQAQTSYEATIAEDGQEFQLGDIRFRVIHTPGHTPESSCFLLINERGAPHAVFTGDTLFIGEVGRPDLAIKSDLTREDLAGMLYDSLHDKLMTLPDEVIVFPAHGAGSACGKNISQERSSTIGLQKQLNYALQPMSKQAFVEKVTTGILPAPQYFAKAAALNKHGYHDIDELLQSRTQPLSVEDVINAQREGALILDTRTTESFAQGYIPNSLFIGLDGSFASWVGTLIEDLDQPIVVITASGREQEAILRLARVGYSNALGYLKGGIDAWTAEGMSTEQLASIQAEELAQLYLQTNIQVLDVRKPGEYEADHVQNAISYPLDFINAHLADLEADKPYYVHCKSGFRSMIAASVLKRAGYEEVINVDGGIMALEETNIPRQLSACSN
ncbi:MAG: rhodanese-like domain-containing protein [Bacteroidota bacterium]